MKLHNPFKSNNTEVESCAYISIMLLIGFFVGFLANSVGWMTAIVMLGTLVMLLFALTPLYLTIRYVFTGK